MNLYEKPNRPDHARNNTAFLRLMREFPGIASRVFQPSPEKAPWHWQVLIPGTHYDQLVNFWPHVMKGQREGFRAVEGEEAVRGIILSAYEDATEERYDVIEE